MLPAAMPAMISMARSSDDELSDAPGGEYTVVVVVGGVVVVGVVVVVVGHAVSPAARSSWFGPSQLVGSEPEYTQMESHWLSIVVSLALLPRLVTKADEVPSQRRSEHTHHRDGSIMFSVTIEPTYCAEVSVMVTSDTSIETNPVTLHPSKVTAVN